MIDHTKLEKYKDDKSKYLITEGRDAYENAASRKKMIPKFLKFIEENPEIEAAMMDNIRKKCKKNQTAIDEFYVKLAKNYNQRDNRAFFTRPWSRFIK